MAYPPLHNRSTWWLACCGAACVAVVLRATWRSGATVPELGPARGVSIAPAASEPTLNVPPGRVTSAPSAPLDRSFAPTIANAGGPSGPAPLGMVWIPGGEFSMGSRVDSETLCELPGVTQDALPVHRVYVDGFWMDATEVTNAEFARFVTATGYVTVAERKPTADELPGVPMELLVEGSAVFTPATAPVSLEDPNRWWRYQNGASWRRPAGPGSSLAGKERYPVVQLAHADADAYARWANKRMPTEAEWEFAARGGLAGKLYAWGDELHPNGAAMANTYQGEFPSQDSARDGFAGLAPVASFPANGYGLYDVAGNAWEWVSDVYRADYYAELAPAGVARNPRGPSLALGAAAPGIIERVQRGGSFLCSEQYCTRYLVGARGRGEVSSTGNHIGVRLVRDAPATR